jgi:hypothetical protein
MSGKQVTSIVFNCNDIIDLTSLGELVSTRDSGGVNVNYFQPPVTLPQDQLVTQCQYFEHKIHSCNMRDGYEWLQKRGCQIKYLKIEFPS